MTTPQKLLLAAIACTLMACNGEATISSTSKSALVNRDDDTRPNIIVIVTDDQGYADIGSHGSVSDIVTPNIDQLAADGVTMSSGYITAPQCTPSRAGLLTGRYQQRFGVDDNTKSPLPLSELTIGDRMKTAGYRTGMIGKWHLEVLKASEGFDVENMTLDEQKPYFPDNRGFDDVYSGYINPWWSNFDLSGNTVSTGFRNNDDYRINIATDTANAFINQHADKPFLLYVSYFAPHVPLEAPSEYLSRFSHIPQERRRYALAMMAAVDDGVGAIREQLSLNNIDDNTLIFFISDNGAPIGTSNSDLPVSNTGGAWDGSLNTPFIGEKGMLTEGGIRVPFIASWPRVLPKGTTYDQPVSSLDIAATSLAVSNQPAVAALDGDDLIANLTGTADTLSDRTLYWRFWTQSAARQGNWKYLKAGNEREYLFDVSTDLTESQNMIDQHPEIATALRSKLASWSEDLPHQPPANEELTAPEQRWFEFYLD